MADGFGLLAFVDYLLQNFVARCKAPRMISSTPRCATPEHFVRGNTAQHVSSEHAPGRDCNYARGCAEEFLEESVEPLSSPRVILRLQLH